MRAVNKAIPEIIPVPVAAPAVVGMKAFPIVAQDLDPSPFQAESPGNEDVEIHCQAVQVLTRQGFGQTRLKKTILLLRTPPGMTERQPKPHQVGIFNQLRNIKAEELLLIR